MSQRHSVPLVCGEERRIHAGSATLPPLSEVGLPVTLAPLRVLVKPPDVETLWEWCEDYGHPDADPSWGDVWPSSIALAELILQDQSLVSGQRVVELGAGLGLAGLAAAQAGAKSVLLLDREPIALHCAMSSAEVNGLQTLPVDELQVCAASSTGCVGAALFDWSKPTFASCATVALGAEVLYDLSSLHALAATIVSLLGAQPSTNAVNSEAAGLRLLLTDPARERVSGCRAAFIAELAKTGAKVHCSSMAARALQRSVPRGGPRPSTRFR